MTACKLRFIAYTKRIQFEVFLLVILL